MAMNPMQKRARQAFLIGFLVALLVMAIVVMVLLKRIQGLNQTKEALEALQKTYLVASSDLESGQEITMADFSPASVQTTVDPTEVISDEDFQFFDKNGEVVEKVDEEGNPITKKMIMKIDVPAGTIVTKNMIDEYDDQIKSTDRIREFSMISLPSQLKNGDYIDIRLSIPNGQDYIVLSKKKILGCGSSTIWLRLNELELELMNSAIVENYTMSGSRLYALEYVEPGRQTESVPTYVASEDIIRLMAINPNITEEISNGYFDSLTTEVLESRARFIQPEVDKNKDNQAGLVSAGNASEQESIRAARQAYVDSLSGSESVGYTEDN